MDGKLARTYLNGIHTKYKFTERVGNSDIHCAHIHLRLHTLRADAYIYIGWAGVWVRILFDENTIALGYEITSFAYLLFCRTPTKKNGEKMARQAEDDFFPKVNMESESRLYSFLFLFKNWRNDLYRFPNHLIYSPLFFLFYEQTSRVYGRQVRRLFWWFFLFVI